MPDKHRRVKSVQVETETKFRVNIRKVEEIGRALVALGARLAEKRDGTQWNSYYDTPQGLLRRKGAALRLREDEHGVFITLKKKPKDASGNRRDKNRHKRREEYESEVGSAEVLREIFDMFRLKETRYMKLRQHFILKRVKVELDFVPELRSHFAEIEGSPTAINRLRARLGLSWDDVEPKSYIELILEVRQKKKDKKKRNQR